MALFVKCLDLKALFAAFVVLRWWWDSASGPIVPPALNLKGIEARMGNSRCYRMLTVGA
jgi:hypothetical protein